MHDDDAKRRDDLDAIGWPDDSYSSDLGHGDPQSAVGGLGPDEARALHDHETVPGHELDRDERERLMVLRPGTRLEQGSVYVDLDALEAGPFRALGGQAAGDDQRLVAKRPTDPDLWRRLVPREDGIDVVRPDTRDRGRE